MIDASAPGPGISPFHLEATQSKHMRLTDLTVHIPATLRSSRALSQEPSPARWRTIEFRFYAVLVSIAVLYMAWIPITLSSSTHPNYPRFRSRLSKGWMFGRLVDNSDAQYRGFRNNFIPLVLGAGVFLLAKFVRTRLHGAAKDNLYLLRFNCVASIVMLLALHGTSILKILPILTANYLISKTCGASKAGPICSWIFNVVVIFMNDWHSGYKFGNIMPSLAFLDSLEGIYPRWHVTFNITMLRLVSFSMDYYWACNNPGPLENVAELNEKHRQTISHPEPIYSYLNYISYVLYPPLYLAGPIMTFNDYIWQHRKPLNIPRAAVLSYLFRFLFTMLTMEFILHFMYVVAMKDTKAWMGDTPTQIALIGFWNLIIVWLKLMIFWRFFRLWAMAAGIEAPENMIRCMANNYSTFGFWRSWHRSYNLWLTRYIYVPLGGRDTLIINTLLVFTFVALWHDLTFRLLAWGWLVSLFIVPELIARYALPESKYGQEPWYRHVCAVGAVCNMLMMATANLVGFVVGIDGTGYFVQQVFGTAGGWQFVFGAFVSMYAAAHLMFEYREEEKRNGIIRKC
ncbi:MBOAT, membrane-bound O-acyltransferase family-domain-containing protein [Mycena maculata]|uniref:MBOAT, membrane-bound O-acyltransferase family-domain-containing protein n=1 Tax=Mycena maculata TaxID=230809 RepID=A0AAD7IZR5_9AGAR|nr:MBOAT, membrane-bound O-acyltransferase family-domain-containing protein [Mycena maculata]